jgi:hypothetical protein
MVSMSQLGMTTEIKGGTLGIVQAGLRNRPTHPARAQADAQAAAAVLASGAKCSGVEARVIRQWIGSSHLVASAQPQISRANS